jgi:hypothetical protein
VQRCLVELRLEHDMPFDWLVDNSRWMRKPRSYSSLEEMLRITAHTYRRALWTEADVYVEIWIEKDALADVLYPITSEYDVPLMVSRGYLHHLPEGIGRSHPGELQARVRLLLRRLGPEGQEAADKSSAGCGSSRRAQCG